MNRSLNKLTPLQALQTLSRWCAYSERCQQDVLQKLKAYGLGSADAQRVLCQLIENDFVNEERYAISYASGHFRIKHWGWRKIEFALRAKGISAYCIDQAKKQLIPAEVNEKLTVLWNRKWASLPLLPKAQREWRVQQYLLQKGYTLTEIRQASDHPDNE